MIPIPFELRILTSSAREGELRQGSYYLFITNHLWNILGMYAVGFAAVLAGGCPLRQLILAGQGSSDSAVTVLGMFFAAALCHNFGLASSGTAMNAETGELVAGAVTPNGKVACIICIIACFIIAFTNKREQAK